MGKIIKNKNGRKERPLSRIMKKNMSMYVVAIVTAYGLIDAHYVHSAKNAPLIAEELTAEKGYTYRAFGKVAKHRRPRIPTLPKSPCDQLAA